jgi:threonine dehydrogenase-like Zn-dependent dehydrogenase
MARKMTQPSLEILDTPRPHTQRIAILREANRIELAYATIPEPGPEEIRIKIKWVGICGSDVEAFRGTRQPEFLSFPTRLGHEVGGIIDQVGSNVLGLQVGDQVSCRYVWGAFAEYLVCSPFNVKVVPSRIPLKEVSLLETLPGIIHAAELSRISSSTTVLVTGQGVSGLILTQVISLYSPKRLVVTDIHEKNLDLARKYGATDTYLLNSVDASSADAIKDQFPDGCEVVIPCLLEGDGMIDAVDAASFGGRIVMYGCIGLCRKPFDFFKVHRKRLEIYSTEPRSDIDMRRYFQEGVQLLLDGLLNTREIVSKTVSLENIQEAFDLRSDHSNDTIHVLVDCESPPQRGVFAHID